MHFRYVCQFGKTHGQCRCASVTKTDRPIECPTPNQCRESDELFGARKEIITFDLDSTLADTGHRHSLIDRENGTDWNAYSLACSDDTPIAGMVETVRLFAKIPGIEVHALSGRASVALENTRLWFARHGIPIEHIWLDEDPKGWSDKFTHAEYKLHRLRQIERVTGKRVRLHFDDWATVASVLEKNGVPCVCVRTPQEIEELVNGNTDAEIR